MYWMPMVSGQWSPEIPFYKRYNCTTYVFKDGLVFGEVQISQGFMSRFICEISGDI